MLEYFKLMMFYVFEGKIPLLNLCFGRYKFILLFVTKLFKFFLLLTPWLENVDFDNEFWRSAALIDFDLKDSS